jgi:tetratricopeptide (TPR) repeat protein
MPRKIKWLWVVCILAIFFGFIYLSFEEKMEEARKHAEAKASQAVREVPATAGSKPRYEGETFKVDPLREIRELNALGQYNEAIEMAEGVAALNPDHPKVYTWWGISLVKGGKKKEAIEKFMKAAELDGTYSKTFLYWGLTLAMDGKAEEAIVKYRKVLELEPENSNAYAYWGAALGQLNRYRQAVEKLERALELHPNNSRVFGVLVDSLYYLKRYREAWDVVGRAREAKVSIPEDSLNRLSEVFPEPTGR